MRPAEILVCALAVTPACKKEEPPTRTPRPAPIERSVTVPATWSCWQRDPAQPRLPQGDVFFTKQRLVGTTLETQNTYEQHGSRGATRLAYHPVGDHLEASFVGKVITAQLLSPDASRWKLHMAGDDMDFTDETSIEDGTLTITSTDATPDGPQVTKVRYLPVGCDVVDAELAKYP